MSTRAMDRIIAHVNRSERYTFAMREGVFDFTVVYCADCSTRTTETTIPSEEVVEHDDWHDMIATPDATDSATR